MFPRLLIAIKRPSEAIPLAIVAAALTDPGGHADVVHAVPAGDPDSAALQAGVESVRAQGIDAIGYLHPIGARTVAEDVAGLALEVGAGCILLGSRGLRGLRALVEGSVSHGVLTATTLPVVVVPDGASLPMGGIRRVLAAVADESEIDAVIGAAAACGETVMAVHAPRAVAVHSGPRGSYVEAPETSNDVLALAAATGRRAGRKLLTLRLESGGPAAEQIAEAAEHFGADLLVVGSHRPREVEAAIAGSVGHRLLSLAGLPVLFTARPAVIGKEISR